MNVLGLSFGFHDSAAALVIDGEVMAATHEERHSRLKNDRGFPTKAIDACLRQTTLEKSDVDHVVFHENPILKFDRILYGILYGLRRKGLVHSGQYLRDTLIAWIRQRKFNVRELIAHDLNLPLTNIHTIKHHQAHAASAFFCSPFERATVVTLDGVGEYDTASVSLGEGMHLKPLSAVSFPHSIGLFYSALTAYLGFEVNEGEYKVMGMAGFGEDTHHEEISRLASSGNGRFRINQKYFNFFTPEKLPFTQQLTDLLGPPRDPGTLFKIGDPETDSGTDSNKTSSRHYANVAASLQRVTEDLILDYVAAAIKKTGVSQVAMAGGVALNSLANGKIQRQLGCDLYIQPAAGDAGGALGAALYFHTRQDGATRPKPLFSASLGSCYDEDEIERALKEQRIVNFMKFDDAEAAIAKTAGLLAQGAVIGWFQGRSEWGPRALGHRSILANPCLANMQDRINEKIKFREPFRPFAPAVLAERAQDFFEIAPLHSLCQPESFMLSVAKARPEARKQIPSAIHVDGTSRVQLVWKEPATAFRRLIETFDAMTDIPVLINTSFNRRGEPIVETPADALNTFFWSGLDYLVMSNFLICKDTAP